MSSGVIGVPARTALALAGCSTLLTNINNN